jgi:transcriptional regulator with XRE-family HTH domain
MTDDRSKEIMANNIKRYMDMKGVSNQQLCDTLNFKYTTFMDWIKGVTYPRIGKIEAMANYFGVLKSDLIEEKTEEHREMQQKNSVLADLTIRMRTDNDFFSVVEGLDKLDPVQLASVKQVVDAFLLMKG